MGVCVAAASAVMRRMPDCAACRLAAPAAYVPAACRASGRRQLAVCRLPLIDHGAGPPIVVPMASLQAPAISRWAQNLCRPAIGDLMGAGAIPSLNQPSKQPQSPATSPTDVQGRVVGFRLILRVDGFVGSGTVSTRKRMSPGYYRFPTLHGEPAGDTARGGTRLGAITTVIGWTLGGDRTCSRASGSGVGPCGSDPRAQRRSALVAVRTPNPEKAWVAQVGKVRRFCTRRTPGSPSSACPPSSRCAQRVACPRPGLSVMVSAALP
jgi:hypothetical protein